MSVNWAEYLSIVPVYDGSPAMITDPCNGRPYRPDPVTPYVHLWSHSCYVYHPGLCN